MNYERLFTMVREAFATCCGSFAAMATMIMLLVLSQRNPGK
jgi:hypothetical protein